MTREEGGTVLIVEDDRAIRDGIKFNLERRGLTVFTAADGNDGMRKAADVGPDLVVLDIMLPGRSGLEILSAIRERDSDVQVLVLSARGAIDDKVEGLGLGADDYMTKPFDLRELMARVEVMLSRRRRTRLEETEIRFSDVVIDPASRKVTRGGREVVLTKREFDLLMLLARTPGRSLPRETIVDQVWGWGFDGTVRTVDNFIVSLRQKLEPDPLRPRHIRTVRGVGYKLELNGEDG